MRSGIRSLSLVLPQAHMPDSGRNPAPSPGHSYPATPGMVFQNETILATPVLVRG